MGEKDPGNVERLPLRDECMHCNRKYRITKDNAAVFEFTKQPECNHISAECTKCGGHTRIFVGSETMQQATAWEIPVVPTEYAPDFIYQSWLELSGIELIKEREVTPRALSRVAFLGWLLEHNMIDFNQDGDIQL